ncbi:MAG: Smr/MutS family protein [Gammaproteobacteria bacterium]|nr:Smr/MutS family protein [Gammaproteobacteria bacterium]
MTQNSDDDSELFRKAMAGVKPISKRHLARVVARKKVAPKLRKLQLTAMKPKIEWQGFNDNFALCDVNDELFFVRPGVQNKTIKQLRQGKMNLEACLDLHGMTVAVAREELQRFLAGCEQERYRCVLIIHGKGSATIKSAVNGWLREYKNTLCFCSAKPKDGGLGAVYLLLRKVDLN